MSGLPDKLQHWVAVQIMECLSADEFCWNEWKDESGSNYTGIIECGEGVRAVFNLPRGSGHLYVVVSDGEPGKISRVMAHLDELDGGGDIHQRHVVRFELDYLAKRGIVGVLLSPIQVSPMLHGLGDRLEYNGCALFPTLVIFLSESEYQIWKSQGNDSLMDHFESVGKDIVSIA